MGMLICVHYFLIEKLQQQQQKHTYKPAGVCHFCCYFRCTWCVKSRIVFTYELLPTLHPGRQVVLIHIHTHTQTLANTLTVYSGHSSLSRLCIDKLSRTAYCVRNVIRTNEHYSQLQLKKQNKNSTPTHIWNLEYINASKNSLNREIWK